MIQNQNLTSKALQNLTEKQAPDVLLLILMNVTSNDRQMDNEAFICIKGMHMRCRKATYTLSVVSF